MRARIETSLPRIEHRFATLADAIAAARIVDDHATLDVPVPDSVPRGERVLLRFRIGRGRMREVVGRGAVRGKRFRVALEGFDAQVVRVAIGRLADLNVKRRFERIPCAIRAAVELPSGESVSALLWQVAAGGAGLAELEKNLPSGKVVRLYFDDGSAPVPARVMWSVGPGSGGSAGLSFVPDPANRPAIERLLSLARAR